MNTIRKLLGYVILIALLAWLCWLVWPPTIQFTFLNLLTAIGSTAAFVGIAFIGVWLIAYEPYEARTRDEWEQEWKNKR